MCAACGNSVERDIETLVKGGDAAVQAEKRLGLIRLTRAEPLIAAFENRAHPLDARLAMAGALSRLHLREPDRRIERAMIGALEDPHPALRARAVDELGRFGRRDLVEPVLQLIERERDNQVRLRGLLAVELLMGIEDTWSRNYVRTDRMDSDQRERFTQALVALLPETRDDSLLFGAREWLEIVLAENAEEADELALKARLAEAEAILVAARDLLPDSMHINFKLGRFYYDYVDRAKGEQVLHKGGSLVYVPELKSPPAIDGDLSDPVWQAAARLTDFYSDSAKISAIPSAPETEVLLGHHREHLYIGFAGYEESMSAVSAPEKPRDAEIWMDDSIHFLMDTNRDADTSYIVGTSAAGVFMDMIWPKRHSSDSTFETGTEYGFATDASHWYVEYRIPLEPMQASSVPGTAWNFNIFRVRIGNRSEHTTWKVTHYQVRNQDRWGLLVFR